MKKYFLKNIKSIPGVREDIKKLSMFSKHYSM
jgi:hypothetical protein